MKPLALVLALARRGALGKGGALPWRIPEDLRHFRDVTRGHAVIMGRRTWDEVKRPLPGRRNLVVSRDRALSLDGATVCASLDEALERARETDPEPCVIGGAELYRLALPHATRIELTEIDRDVDADTFFELDRAGFVEVARRAAETPDVTFVTLRRQGA